MDRNSVVGLLLIGLILVGYSFWMQPSDLEIEEMKRKKDSIAAIDQHKVNEAERVSTQAIKETEIRESLVNESLENALDSATVDSLQKVEFNNRYGRFANAAQGNEDIFIIENDKIKLEISNKGARPVRVELKEYKTYNQTELYLFTADSNNFNINFWDNNRLINSSDFYFETHSATAEKLELRLYDNLKKSYIAYIYSFNEGNYLVDFKIVTDNLQDIVRVNNQELAFQWNLHIPRKEKDRKSEAIKSTIYYKYKDEQVDYLSETASDKLNLEAATEWVSFKQQFFSAAMISSKGFDKVNSRLEVEELDENSIFTKKMSAYLTLVLQDDGDKASYEMSFYFGPNHYQTLKTIGIGLEDQIDLGWAVFRFINKWVIITLFNWLDSMGLGYGMIILLLTIIIKMILSPITYKNYLSSAKMSVIKPEVNEIMEKHKNDDPLKKQQAVMQLYKRAGVNPMAGCIPALLQIPILYAMFKFFPSSIELRQEGFLWAEDLSTYDSIYELPFSIPFYGTHVSLFTLLMAVSTFLYTKYNMQNNSMAGPQAAQMKIVMYFMPFMMIFFFNSFPAGLTYYYFSANIISVIQQLVIKKYFIDEDKLHRQIQENKKKPISTKKSAFQERLEKIARQKQERANQLKGKK
jgi:YidC/Oxa1 family membrane protein insertase